MTSLLARQSGEEPAELAALAKPTRQRLVQTHDPQFQVGAAADQVRYLDRGGVDQAGGRDQRPADDGLPGASDGCDGRATGDDDSSFHGEGPVCWVLRVC